MSEVTWLLSLLVGIVPYSIKRHQRPGGEVLHIRALSWSVLLHWKQSGGCDWTIHIPLIERAQHLFWGALGKLHEEQQAHLAREEEMPFFVEAKAENEAQKQHCAKLSVVRQETTNTTE
jgi:hypothetical protein